jgi:endo-1,4-beta-D-glucanase Y/4-amino-4-deoxy-L-arabinose transferase-like glycosyltransferase
MFNYPYYESDEGIYFSQAWALATTGTLSPYTYWYDHAPAGWMQLAIWILISGGVHAFGFAINSGRVFMLVMQLASSILLYYITKRLTESRSFSIVSVIIFCLSPLGIYFQRRVLLDNMMVFWVLLSVLLIISYKNRLSRIAYASIAMGIAILTKETAVIFVPLLTYYVYIISEKKHRSFVISQWILIQALLVGMYLFYALVKNELFPTGTFLGGPQEHVSLMDALSYQSKRQGGGGVFDPASYFWRSFNKVWVREDPILIYGGILATLTTAVMGIYNKSARLLAGLSIFFWLFLLKGGLIIEFYILPLIPIMALNISYVLWSIYSALKVLLENNPLKKLAYVIPMIFIYVWLNQFRVLIPNVRGGINMYTARQTQAQLQAVEWIKKYRNPADFIVIDNYAYIDLKDNKEKIFNNVEWFTKIDTDRDIREGKLKGDYKNIDYLAVTPQIETDTQNQGLYLIDQGIRNSRELVSFDHDFWRVRIYGLLTPKRIARASYENDKIKYLKSGKVTAPNTGDTVFLKHQADMLTRSVFEDDKPTFDNLLRWTTQNMQKSNNLFISELKAGTTREGEAETAPNTDIAFALLLASNKWKNPTYQEQAVKIITALRQTNTITWQGKTYLKRADILTPANPQLTTIYLPSYNPTAYTYFAQVEDNQFWQTLKDTTYEVLNKCTFTMPENTLPPTACTLTASPTRATEPTITTSNTYWMEAHQLILKIVMDNIITGEPRSKEYIQKLTSFKKEWTQRYQLGAIYDQTGKVLEDYETVRAYAPAVAVLTQQDPTKAKEMWDLKLRDKFYEDATQAYWEDKDNIENQTLPYFATKIYEWTQETNP